MSAIDLRLGDCLDLMGEMDAGSVDAIITDPLYSTPSFYAAIENAKCLKSGGNGFAFVNAKWLNRILRAMKTELPTFAYLNPAGAGMNGKIITKVHHVVWWGSGKLRGYIPDGWLSTNWSAPYNNAHKWAKNPKYLRMLIVAATNEGDTVFDPFMGCGDLGIECVNLRRNYIGYEIDQISFTIAERRIADAQLQIPMLLPA